MDRYGTGPLSFGAFFWIPGVKTERTAKKRRKKRPKWERYSHLKRVRVADLFVMDRYDLAPYGGRVGDRFMNLIQPFASRVPYMYVVQLSCVSLRSLKRR